MDPATHRFHRRLFMSNHPRDVAVGGSVLAPFDVHVRLQHHDRLYRAGPAIDGHVIHRLERRH